MTKRSLLERLEAGEVLVADGATGTNLQARGLQKGAPAEKWVLEQPEQIERLYRDFVEAGSDIILTCTFGGSPVRLKHADLGNCVEDVNRRAVELALKATKGTDVLIAGSIGPTGEMLKPLGLLEEADAEASFAQQARILSEAGVDFLLVETQFDIAEASVAVKAARSVCDLPVICSFSYDRGTRTMMGVRPSKMAKNIAPLGVAALGINCGRSLDENFESLQQLREASDLPIWFKPNAGLPTLDEQGNSLYDVSPEQMGEWVPRWIEAGARIIGGCCGSSPEHIRQIAQAVAAYAQKS